MKIQIEYFAQARDAAGCASETVELGDGATLLGMVKLVASKHGPRLARLLLDHDELAKQTIFTVGDHHVLAARDAALSDGDRVTIIPPISGG
jgi:molybdopterin synthase sulfur carrier subunit